MRRAALTTVIAAAGLFVAACTNTQTGQAVPSAGQSAASSSGTVVPGLSGLKACSLLTDDEAKQAVPNAGPHVDQGEQGGPGTSDCKWSGSVTNGSHAITFGVTVRPGQRIDDMVIKPGGAASDARTTGGRPAKEIKRNEGNGTCIVGIAVGSGRVDINAATSDTTNVACSVVSKVSDFVEPRLPAS
ncbi:DUF3558 family protein [Amycolatopsis pigmentata]|uniref:DUF3558 family protein n=1 Tax=Amycolatopsis pigmentata TaxID=450801 RepID=A0ABW5FV23_9PSEU